MSEPQYPQTPPPPPTDPKDPKKEPYGETTPPQKDPYGEPKPPPKYEPTPPPKYEPTPPETPPCPPKDDCPKPKPCPEPPKQPPDPCDDKTATPEYPGGTGGTGGDPGGGTGSGTGGGTYQGQGPTGGGTGGTDGGSTGGYTGTPGGGTGGGTGGETGGTGGGYGSAGSGGTGSGANGESPAAHLAALRQELEAGQKKLQELEPLQKSVADIELRIVAFEKAVDDQSTLEATYKAFYKEAQTQLAELECSIPTLRCQIEISDKARKCVCDAIAAIDTKTAKLKKDRDDQKKVVDALEVKSRRTGRDLEWTKKWHDFLKKGLQEQVGKQRDALKALKGKLTPKTDPCEAYFYVYELERLVKSLYDKPDACWMDDIWLATYIDCWPWENYKKAWNRALVAYNKADAADKLAKSQLEQAKKLLADLEKLVTESLTKRQEWILKEIKTADCCGPKSNCP